MKKVFYSLLMVAAVIWGFWFAGQSYKKTHFTGGELELYGALQTACAGGVEARFEKVLELQEGSLTLARWEGSDWSAFVAAFGESKLVERTGQSRPVHTAERYYVTLSGTDGAGQSWAGQMKLYADELMDIQLTLTGPGDDTREFAARYELGETDLLQVLEGLMEPLPGAPEGPFTLTKKGEVTDGSGNVVKLGAQKE